MVFQFLLHVRHSASKISDLLAIERYAATVRRDQPSQDVEKSALSTAAWSDDGNEFSRFSAQADLLEDLQCITAPGEGF